VKPRRARGSPGRLRELQDRDARLRGFIPLAFHPDNTALSHIPKPNVYADLRNIAVSRLLLIISSTSRRTGSCSRRSLAQNCSAFRRERLGWDGGEEKIYHDAGAKTASSRRAMTGAIDRAAGRVPVERDTLYRPVDRSKLPRSRRRRGPESVSLR